MKKQLTSKTVYEPNGYVKVAVTNKPVHDERGIVAGYDATIVVTVTRKLLQDEVKFGSDDDIADFMSNVEYDEPQQSLDLGKVS